MRSLLKLFFLCLILPLNLFTAEYEVSICTIFKNDAKFLKEWLEFHRIQGVEHFFLYNNNSEDNFQEVLKPYINANVVTLVEWPYTYEPNQTLQWIEIQRRAYRDCFNNYGHLTNWIAVIDSDEFLFCPDGKKIPEFLEDFKEYGGVVVNWLMFGTSDVEDVPAGKLMIEMLTRCADSEMSHNHRVKTIAQPKYVKRCNGVHIFNYKEGYYAVNVNGKPCYKKNTDIITHDKLRINHYWSRTKRYFRETKIASRHDRRSQDTELAMWERESQYNTTENTDILQFVPELRKRMGLRK